MKNSIFFLSLFVLLVSSCKNDDVDDIPLSEDNFIFALENASYADAGSSLSSEFIYINESTRTLRNKITFNFVRNTETYDGPLEISIIPNSGRAIENYTVKILAVDDSEILPGFTERYPLVEQNSYTFFYEIILDEEPDEELDEEDKFEITDYLSFPSVVLEVSATNSDVLWHNRIAFPTIVKLKE